MKDIHAGRWIVVHVHAGVREIQGGEEIQVCISHECVCVRD
jgi:hypothetical protein